MRRRSLFARPIPLLKAFVDGRLSIPVAKSPTEAPEFLIKIRIRDQRQLAHPERRLCPEKTAAIHKSADALGATRCIPGTCADHGGVSPVSVASRATGRSSVVQRGAVRARTVFFDQSQSASTSAVGFGPKLALLLHPRLPQWLGCVFAVHSQVRTFRRAAATSSSYRCGRCLCGLRSRC